MIVNFPYEIGTIFEDENGEVYIIFAYNVVAKEQENWTVCN